MATQTREEREAVKAAALDYLAAGLSVLPIHIGKKLADKLPQGEWEKWQTERATPEQVKKWAPWGSYALGVGILGGRISGNLWILDFDLEAEELYPAWRALLAEKYPALAAALEGAPVARSGKGYHVYMRLPEARPNKTLAGYYAEVDGKPKVQKLIETRGEGGYIVAPPSPHPSGARYTWIRPLEAIPTLSPELTEQLLAACRSFDRRERRHEAAAARPLPATRHEPRPAESHGDKPTLEELREMLEYISYPTTYEEWVSVLMAIHSIYPGPEGLALAVEWREWEPGEIAEKWKSFKRDAGGVGVGTLVYMAKQGGYKPPRRERAAGPRYKLGAKVNPVNHEGDLLLPEPATVIEHLGTHEGETGYRYKTATGEEFTTVESRLEPAEPERPSRGLALPLVEGLREIVLVDSPEQAERLNAAGLSLWAMGFSGGLTREHAAALQEAGVERVVVAMSSPTVAEAAIRALLRAKAIEGLLVATSPGERSLDALAEESGLSAVEEALAGAIRVGAWLGEHLTANVELPLSDLEEERLLARAAELYTWLRDREPLHAEAMLTELCERLDIRYEEIRPRLERAYERKTQEETRATLDSLLHAAARANTAGDVDKTREILDTATRAFSSSFVEYPRAYTLADLEADILTEPDSLPLPWHELSGVRFPRAGLSVISADSKNGKTTMMLNLAEQYLSTKALQGESIYFYTYEEPASHLALKLIMLMSGVMLHEEQNFYAYRGYMRDRADGLHTPQKAIEEAIARFNEATQSGRLVLSDKMPTLEELVASLGLIARTGRAAAVFVDYVQRIPAPRDYKAGTRQLELAYIVQELRKTAVTKKLAIITGSQVNPKGELREARDIFHEAQVVLQLEPGQVDAETLMVKVDKQRSGVSGITAALKWHRPTLRITGDPSSTGTRPRRVVVDG
jgi:hypothetical protein